MSGVERNLTAPTTYREVNASDLSSVDLDDDDFEEFLISMNESELGGVEEISKESVNQNLHLIFISSCSNFLQNYAPLYASVQDISAYATELGSSLAKIDQASEALKFQNRSHLFKLEKLQDKETELREKHEVLENLRSDSHIDPALVRHLLHEEPIDEKFFKAFKSVEALKKLYDELGTIETPEQGLRNSLMKNFNEIRSVGMSKMIKALHTSIQKAQAPQLRLFRESLEDNEEGNDRFLEMLTKHRKQVVKEQLLPLKNKINYSMTVKMSAFLNEVFLSFFDIMRSERAFMKEVFEEEQALIILMEVTDELFAEILQRVERSLIIEKDFFEMFQIRECLERHKLSFSRSMLSEGDSTSSADGSQVTSNSQNQPVNAAAAPTSVPRSVQLVDVLIKRATALIRENLSNESAILLTTKFNIQRISAYQCVVDLVDKIANVFNILLSKQQQQQEQQQGWLLQYLYPIENLIESKMAKKSPAACIFSANVQIYLLQELKKFEASSPELKQRLEEYALSVTENIAYLSQTNINELLRFAKMDNFEHSIADRKSKKDTEEQSKLLSANAKRAFVFLLNLQSSVSRKIMFRDRLLIQDEVQRTILKQKIIADMESKYTIVYDELNEYCLAFIEGNNLQAIPEHAKYLAKKFQLDISDYIEVGQDSSLTHIPTPQTYSSLFEIDD